MFAACQANETLFFGKMSKLSFKSHLTNSWDQGLPQCLSNLGHSPSHFCRQEFSALTRLDKINITVYLGCLFSANHKTST